MSECWRKEKRTKLCVVSWTCFMPSRWKTIVYLKEHYQVELLVIAPPKAKISKVYEPSGYLTPSSVGLESIPEFVALVPLKNKDKPTRGFRGQKLKCSIRRFDPDIIWIHGEPLQPLTKHMCLWFWFRRRPRIYQAAIDNIQTLGSQWRRPVNRILLSRITGFLAAGKPTADALVKMLRIPKHKVHITYLPNISMESPRAKSVATDRCPLRVGFAGRLVERKGILVLLRAFDRLHPGIRLHVAGYGDEEILSKIQKRRRVTYWGLLSNLSEFLRSIDVLVVPSLSTNSWTEQFGRVIAEAFSIGIPVIGSNSGAIPDVVGDGGLIYDEGSSKALGEAISNLDDRNDLYEKLSRQARQRFHSCFSVAAHARSLACIFELPRYVEQRET